MLAISCKISRRKRAKLFESEGLHLTWGPRGRVVGAADLGLGRLVSKVMYRLRQGTHLLSGEEKAEPGLAGPAFEGDLTAV